MAKRKSAAQKKAAEEAKQAELDSQIEEEAVQQEDSADDEVKEEVEENGTEETNGEALGEAAQNYADQCKEMLEGLGKAHPFALMARCGKLHHRMRPMYKTEVTEKEIDGEKKKVQSVQCNYCNHCIKIPDINGDYKPVAVKIASDHLLMRLYPEYHELDRDSAEYTDTVEYTMDDGEWYKENSKKYVNELKDKCQGIIRATKRDTSMGEEKQAEKIAKIEKRLDQEDQENLPAYEALYEEFQYPFYRVLHNATTDRGMKYSLKLVKIKQGGEEEEMEVNQGKNKKAKKEEQEAKKEKEEKGEDVEEAKEEEATEDDEEFTPSFRVTITVTKGAKEICSIENTVETASIREAKSETAYKVLEKLLEDKVITKLTRADLNNKNDPKNRNNKRGFDQGGYNRGGQRGGKMFNSGNYNSGGGYRPNNMMNQNMQQQRMMQQQQMMMMQQQQRMMMGGQGMNNQNMMMVPVVMGPTGPMMVMNQNMGMQNNFQQQGYNANNRGGRGGYRGNNRR